MRKLQVIVACILLVGLIGLYVFGSKDVAEGTVRLVSGGQQYEPMVNFMCAYTSNVFSDGRIKRPQDVAEELTAVPVTDHARVTVSGIMKNLPTYTLFDEQYREVYSTQEGFSLPEEPGRYILCVGVTWGFSFKEEYRVLQYFFLIDKPE